MSIWERLSPEGVKDWHFDHTLLNNDPTISENYRTEHLTPEQQVLIRRLFISGCIRFGDFILNSGRKSPYILDLAHAQSDPSLMVMLETAYANLVRSAGPDVISPVPSASVPIGSNVARLLGLPMVTVRIKEQDSNGDYVIDGFTETAVGKNCLILDDAATSGGSIKKAAAALRKRGLRADTALVLMDREEGARKALQKDEIRLLAVFGARQLFGYALAARTQIGERVLSDKNYAAVMRYFDSYASKPT